MAKKIDMQAKALETHFDRDDRGFKFFPDFVEKSDQFFPWATESVKERAIELVYERRF